MDIVKISEFMEEYKQHPSNKLFRAFQENMKREILKDYKAKRISRGEVAIELANIHFSHLEIVEILEILEATDAS